MRVVAFTTKASRPRNEDTYFFADTTDSSVCSVGFGEKEDEELFEWKKENSYIFGVCDGLGSYSGSEQASLFLSHFLVDKENWPDNECEFEMMILAASRMMYSSEEMGLTTIAAAFLQGDQMTVIHAGDSRVYLLTENKIHQLTRDHSNLELLQKCFVELTERECHAHPRYVMNQCVGHKHTQVSKSRFPIKINSGDRLLFMTDGAYLALQEKGEFNLTSDEIMNELKSSIISADDNATAVLVYIE